MTRFVVDCGAVLHLAREGVEVADGHELLAPTLDAELARRVEGVVATATIDALQTP